MTLIKDMAIKAGIDPQVAQEECCAGGRLHLFAALVADRCFEAVLDEGERRWASGERHEWSAVQQAGEAIWTVFPGLEKELCK
jgi:hypothetical protein